MPRLRLSLATMAVFAVSLLAACATGGAGRGDAGPPTAMVVVNNNLTVPTSLTVSLVPENGARRMLGNVSPSGTARLRVTGTLSPGRYRLLGRTTSGNERYSDPFMISAGEEVTWDLQSNIVRVTGN